MDVYTIIHYTFLTLIGLCAGSFFNVLIWRVPRGESVAWPPSHCTSCAAPIKWYDNIPVFSYAILLRGKCRHCNAPITIIYPLVELMTALALVAAWILFDMPPIAAIFSSITSSSTISTQTAWHSYFIPLLRVLAVIMLVPMSVIDIRHYIIPNSFTLPLFALALGLSFVPGHLSPIESLVGAAAGGGSLFALGVIGAFVFKKGDAMGLGDVKLMAAFGALWGYEIALIGIAFGAFLGSIAGGVLILSKHMNDERRIPFGPFLGAGTVAAALAGMPLLRWYLGLFGG